MIDRFISPGIVGVFRRFGFQQLRQRYLARVPLRLACLEG